MDGSSLGCHRGSKGRLRPSTAGGARLHGVAGAGRPRLARAGTEVLVRCRCTWTDAGVRGEHAARLPEGADGLMNSSGPNYSEGFFLLNQLIWRSRRSVYLTHTTFAGQQGPTRASPKQSELVLRGLPRVVRDRTTLLLGPEAAPGQWLSRSTGVFQPGGA